jgi:small conductance mechanosensitive channel
MQIIPENLQPFIIFLSGIAFTFIIARIVHNFLAKHIHKKILEEPKLKTTYLFIRRIIVAAIILFGVASATFTAFPETRGFVASFFVAAGFASIVIGLAAQSTLSNIISGALIAVTHPFRIGDMVMFRNELCNVEDMKLTYTTLRVWDNRRLMIPNSIFQSEVVINYTAIDSTKLVPITVQISYESDLEKASHIMIDIAKRHPDFLPAENLPKVHLMEFGASGINLRLLTRAKDQDIAFEMSKEILRRIKKEFDANGIEIPYPRMHLVPDKKLEERLDRLADSLRTPFSK